jgi:hypothetical protein
LFVENFTAEQYNWFSHTWTPIAPMIQGRSNFAAVVLDGKVVVIGGYDGKITT